MLNLKPSDIQITNRPSAFVSSWHENKLVRLIDWRWNQGGGEPRNYFHTTRFCSCVQHFSSLNIQLQQYCLLRNWTDTVFFVLRVLYDIVLWEKLHGFDRDGKSLWSIIQKWLNTPILLLTYNTQTLFDFANFYGHKYGNLHILSNDKEQNKTV